jgi:hypothetical protein
MGYSDDGEEINENIITDYNSASLMNMRIDEILKDVNRHKRNAQFSNWNGDLDAFWCEVGADVKKGSKEDLDMMELNKKVATVSPIINWSSHSRGFEKLNIEQEIIKNKQYLILTEKEMYIRRLMSEQGKLTKKRDDSSTYMNT